MLYLTRRQKEVLDVIEDYIARRGYAPSLEEIGRALGLSSVATVHKHVQGLIEKGYVRRQEYRGRSIELLGAQDGGLRLPLLGRVAAGKPLEAIEAPETIEIPGDLARRKGRTYVLRVTGDSMIEEQIRDGDYVIVEERSTAQNGETVIALVNGSEATIKKLYRERDGRIRLQPANRAMQPLRYRPEEVTIQGVVIGLLRKY